MIFELKSGLRLPLLLTSMVALIAAGSVVACGDDDDSNPVTPAPGGDGGTADSGNADGGPTGDDDDDDGDGGPKAPAVITRGAERNVENVINPYGLTWGTDGKLYASGSRFGAGNAVELAVWRFNADGTTDTTFGTDGYYSQALAAAQSYGIVELADGSFVVQATSGGKVWLAKLTKSGTGFTFGAPVPVLFGWADDEFAEWPAAPAEPAYASWGISLDKSTAGTEKIVVFAHGAPAKVASGTQRTVNDRWVARVLASDFTADPAFNGGKAFTADADGADLEDNARRGWVDPDGKIVSAGYTNFGENINNHVVLIRLNADGTPDTSFGFGTTTAGASPGQTKFNPFLAANPKGMAEAYAVVRQSNGNYVTTGYGQSFFDTATQENDLVTFRVLADRLDPTYGRTGAFAIQSEGKADAGAGARPFRENGRDLVALSDDRTVHVGCYDDFASIFVLTKDGALDTSALEGGLIRYAHTQPFFGVAISKDGKHIAATATSLPTSGANPARATFLATLKLD